MHESAVIDDVRRRLEALAGNVAPAERIARVTIRVGPLSHVTGPMLADRWAEVQRVPALRSAELRIEPGPDPPDPAASELRILSVTLTDAIAPPGAGGA